MLRKRFKNRPSPALVISCLALFVALSGTTYAATGGNFILGQANSAAAQTSLTSSNAASPTLNVVNTGGRPAARFQANGGKAPFTISNSTKIANLNADLLDGMDSTVFLRDVQVVSDSIPGGNSIKSNSIPCPAGTHVVGGGGAAFGTIDNGTGGGPRISASFPDDEGWRVDAIAKSDYMDSWSLNVYAICAKGS